MQSTTSRGMETIVDSLYSNMIKMERLGGMSSHLSPLVRPTDIGSLLGSNGFQLVTLDSDEIQVSQFRVR